MEDKEKIIIEKYLEGYGQRECATFTHSSVRTVKKVLTKNNISIRDKKEAAQCALDLGKKNQKKSYTEEQKRIVLKEYIENKRGQIACGKIAGVSATIVKRILQDNNVHIRNFSEAATVSNENRSLYKKEDYFSKESSNMAWILGFLAADGCIHKDKNQISIKLSSVDREILEKIKSEIKIERPITEYVTQDGFPISCLTWTCAQHKSDLAKYNIVPQKTFVLSPPYNLNKKYWIDFIRGYFDGDGSISLIHNKGYTSIRWQVCSATKEILEFIVNYFYELGIDKINIQKKDNTFFIQYSTLSSRRIYQILYTDNSLYLKRKKEKFEKILDECKAAQL